jgi:hypothetical protein
MGPHLALIEHEEPHTHVTGQHLDPTQPLSWSASAWSVGYCVILSSTSTLLCSLAMLTGISVHPNPALSPLCLYLSAYWNCSSCIFTGSDHWKNLVLLPCFWQCFCPFRPDMVLVYFCSKILSYVLCMSSLPLDILFPVFSSVTCVFGVQSMLHF